MCRASSKVTIAGKNPKPIAKFKCACIGAGAAGTRAGGRAGASDRAGAAPSVPPDARPRP